MKAMWRIWVIAFCGWGLLATAGHAQAPAQEKRIALVVGNATYPGHVLATAANDAGLVAQTLQAAGFDVAGARDLDAESLRRALRDFVQKAQNSGPDTVAMLYLAGYGLQLAGDNYVVPVDAAPARDTDVPVDALRVSDYVRQLQALPLKLAIVVLDAAREQPFAKGGQPLAGGLAMVESDPKVFTAFNAAPGTVAPYESGAYGAYAQALAEAIRAGGLTLPETFDRVRLRVSDVTKGAQVPWDSRTVGARFVFFERAPDAPQTTAAIPDSGKPIAAYGANDAFAAALARDTIADYVAFLAAFPNDPLAKRVRAIVAARREAITWRQTSRINTPDAYWSYLRRYPKGPHAFDARRRLAILTAPLEPPPSFAAIVYEVPPPPPEEIVYVDRPYLIFSDPVFALPLPPPPPVYFLPPPPPDFVVLPPPPPVVGFYVLPQPLFVPIPAYVVPPAYIAPPPNNIIFANIHNTTVINNVINQPQRVAASQAAAPRIGNPVGPDMVAATATPALPPSVAQRAALIQQGRLAAPAGVLNRAVTPGQAVPAARSGPAASASGSALGAPLPAPQPNPAPTAQPALPPQNRGATAAGVQGAPDRLARPAAVSSVRRGTVAPDAPIRPNVRAARPTPIGTATRQARPAPAPRQRAIARPAPPPRVQPPQIQRPAPTPAMARPMAPPRMAGPPAAPRMAGPPQRGRPPAPPGKPPKR